MQADSKVEERVRYVLPLDDERATIDRVGGKGASLARLAAAGFPVPDGFHVTTDAYAAMVMQNGLQRALLDALEEVDPNHPATLEEASSRIAELFSGAEIPAGVANAVVQAYATLPGSNPAVAVRSSATAEDLPEASFAGQQETYLNVNSPDGLLEATKKCWASLWTARAIAYRARQGIPPEEVALAVVVQLLVPAEAAGILFTVNPVSGERDQLIISAAWGLGEAVVGGAVTPDNLVVEKGTGQVLVRDTADKEVMTVRVNGGTVEESVPPSLREVPVLDDAAAADLAQLGEQIEQLYEMPMDIEWALADGEFAIVQARPITALPPEPGAPAAPELTPPDEWPMPEPDGKYMRTSIIDFMPNPLSPLFATMGVAIYNDAIYQMLVEVTHAEKSPFPEEIVLTIRDYAYMRTNFSAREMLALLGRLAPRLRGLISKGPDHFRDVALPAYRHKVEQLSRRPLAKMTAGELWRDAHALAEAAMYHLAILQVDTLGAAAGSEGLFTSIYQRFFKGEGDPPASTFLMGYDTAPIRSEKSLYDLAQWARHQPTLSEYLLQTEAEETAAAPGGGECPVGIDATVWSEWEQQLEAHLQAFGHILYDLDFAQPVPVEDRAPQLETVKMYLRGEGVNPHERQARLEQEREEATERLLARARGVRGWLLRKAFGWAQAVAEVREDSIASVGLAYPRLRQVLKELGRRLVEAGAIADPSDIFWLEEAEIEARLDALDQGESLPSMRKEIERRRQLRRAEAKLVPPSQLPYSKTYMGLPVDIFLPAEGGEVGGQLQGVGASAGKVTGVACVLHGPRDFDQMEPGAILVAKVTTPAWTPLFAMAAGVVTDIGGPLSHGSIVAREYGIPAVLGTGVATHRIQSGQQITVDGTAGTVILAEVVGEDGEKEL